MTDALIEQIAREWTRIEQHGDVWDQLHPVDRENRLAAAEAVLRLVRTTTQPTEPKEAS